MSLLYLKKGSDDSSKTTMKRRSRNTGATGKRRTYETQAVTKRYNQAGTTWKEQQEKQRLRIKQIPEQ